MSLHSDDIITWKSSDLPADLCASILDVSPEHLARIPDAELERVRAGAWFANLRECHAAALSELHRRRSPAAGATPASSTSTAAARAGLDAGTAGGLSDDDRMREEEARQIARDMTQWDQDEDPEPDWSEVPGANHDGHIPLPDVHPQIPEASRRAGPAGTGAPLPPAPDTSTTAAHGRKR
ncbi:hypothetical protein OPIT5_00180 (plasmid) [Opitutaceae bacterium TAV5]|nr:hypothetical protein OPIT5_00165 [Opitutaceae bacterium TAV5]AHF94985.1 hypothetical protein OPIT5_00180 [Opitutaceae bacterium TAV5]